MPPKRFTMKKHTSSKRFLVQGKVNNEVRYYCHHDGKVLGSKPQKAAYMKTRSAAEKRWEYIMQEPYGCSDYSQGSDPETGIGYRIEWEIVEIA
jgi:hypothetical protein